VSEQITLSGCKHYDKQLTTGKHAIAGIYNRSKNNSEHNSYPSYNVNAN